MRAYGQRWRCGVWVTATCILGVFPHVLLSQSRTAQVLVLPNPTPREPDLEKRFNTKSSPALSDSARVAAYNRQRFELIGRASAHIQSLSSALRNSIAQHNPGTTIAQEEQVAGAIESLAANVYAATASESPKPGAKTAREPLTGADSRTEGERLSAQAKQLDALAQALQTEVSKSTADTLAVGVLTKSAEVRDLAHTLKQRLQANHDGHL